MLLMCVCVYCLTNTQLGNPHAHTHTSDCRHYIFLYIEKKRESTFHAKYILNSNENRIYWISVRCNVRTKRFAMYPIRAMIRTFHGSCMHCGTLQWTVCFENWKRSDNIFPRLFTFQNRLVLKEEDQIM